MNAHRTERRTHPMIGTAATILALLAVTPASFGQNNDDGGVLPALHGTGGTLGVQAPSTVSVACEIEDIGDLAGGQATLRLGGATGIAASTEPDGAMILSGGESLRADVSEDAIALQGSATLALPEQFEVTFEAPQDSVHRTSWIVLHSAEQTLDELLAGEATPLALIHVGPIDGFDVAAFQALVSQEAGDMPGLAVSWVLGSVDSAGAVHLSGVKVPTDGGLLEVVAR